MTNICIKVLCGVSFIASPLTSVACETKAKEEAKMQSEKLTNDFIRLLKSIKVGTLVSELESIKGVKKEVMGGEPFYVIDSDGVSGFIAHRDGKVNNVLIIVGKKELVDVEGILKCVSKLYECKPTKKSKRYIYEYADENISINFHTSKSGFSVEIEASK